MSEAPEALRVALDDRYRIDREVGIGGSATVYLAEDLKHGRQVALKVLRPEFAAVVGRDLFLEEIQTTARLEHPHILSLYDSGEAAGYLFYVMPYVKDESLRDRLERVGQLPVDRAVEIVQQVAGALEFAHSRGIIHRDVKPENILLPGGHAMLADFGIAKAVDTAGRGRATEAGLSFGTAEYMSPEQASGDEPVDLRTDIYSLGAVLYEMLVGEPPHSGTTAQVVLGKILTVRPTRPRDVRESIPEALDGAVMRALSRLPADRFSAMDHFSDALVTMDRRQRPREVKRRLPWPALVGGAVAVAALGWFGSTIMWRDTSALAPLPVPHIIPFVTGPEILGEPAWSRAGNLIAYVSAEAGDDDVWVADPSGSNPLNLTAGPDSRDVHPAWSPDGQRVAFISDRYGGGVFTISALGGSVRRLAAMVFDGGTASPWIPLQWAADGSVVYTSRDETGRPQVYRIADRATEADCLTCELETGGGHSGHLLPGEELLVFRSTHGPEPAGTLYIVNLATGDTREIGGNVALPKWNATLSRLFFVSTQDGGPELWALALDVQTGDLLGEPQRVTSGIAPLGLAVGEDGRMLITRAGATSTVWSFPLDGGLSSLDEGVQITQSQGFIDARPRWMSDGSQVVFESNRRGNRDVWLVDVASGAPTRLTSDPSADINPRPSPDGRWIAFERVGPASTNIRLVRPDGSGETEPDPTWSARFGEICCVSWAPDGRTIAFSVVGESGGRRIATAPLDPSTGAAGEVRVLDVPGESQGRPRFSPDGRFISYEARGEGDWDLWIIDSDGSNPRRITTSSALERQAAWAPDQSALFFVDDFQDIWRVPLDGDANPGGVAELWFDLPTGFGVGEDGLDLRPGRLLIAVEQFAGDIWVVDFAPQGSF